jgi:lipoprotein-anchoring transpeptidase ErfK/SrfK
VFVLALALVSFVLAPSTPAFADDFKPYWVQALTKTELWSANGPGAVSFGPLRQWSYLKVLGPQDGDRFYVENPLTKGTAWVDAKAIAPSGEPPASYLSTGMIVKRTINTPARAVGTARVRSTPEAAEDNQVGTLQHNEALNVIDEVVGVDGDSWYRIADKQFVYADSVRIPTPPAQQHPGRWIDAELTEPAMITLYENNKIVDMALAIKGTLAWETPKGEFTILRRVANETMDSGTLGIPRNAPGGYHVENVLFTQYFTNDGSSFHFNYWSSNFGYRGSHGCLGLSYDDAIFLWQWADVGTLVEIHD